MTIDKFNLIEKLKTIYDAVEAKAILDWLVEDICGKKINNTIEITEAESNKINFVLDELLTGKPLQHILEKAYFYGMPFFVNKHVLIPRPETEELVYMIINKHKNQKINILDIGTGSGCIPITLKKNIPNSNVSAIDISTKALNVAKINALSLGQEICFIEANALALKLEEYPKYDIIVSNPPYITPKEKLEMHSNVLDFEPHLALFVSDIEPLIFYDKIGEFAKEKLNRGGWLYFEINQYLAQETKVLIENKGFKALLHKDINENFRMLSAQLLG